MRDTFHEQLTDERKKTHLMGANLKQFDKERGDLNMAISGLQEKVRNLEISGEKEMAAVKQGYRETILDLKNRIKALENSDAVATMKKSIDDLEGMVAQLTAERDAVATELQATRDSREEARFEAELLRKANGDLQASLTDVGDRLMSSAETGITTRRTTTETVGQLQHQLDEAGRRVMQAEAERDRLIAEGEVVDEERASTAEVLADLRNENGRLEGLVEAVRNKAAHTASRLRRDLDDKQAELDLLTASLAAGDDPEVHAEELDQMAARVAAAEAERQAALLEVADERTRRVTAEKDLADALARVKESHEAREGEVRDGGGVAGLTRTVKSQLAEIGRLTDQVTALRAQITRQEAPGDDSPTLLEARRMVEARDGEIAGLRAALDAPRPCEPCGKCASLGEMNARLTRLLDKARAKSGAEEAEAALVQAVEDKAALEEKVDELEEQVAATSEELEAMYGEIAGLEAECDALRGEGGEPAPAPAQVVPAPQPMVVMVAGETQTEEVSPNPTPAPPQPEPVDDAIQAGPSTEPSSTQTPHPHPMDEGVQTCGMATPEAHTLPTPVPSAVPASPVPTVEPEEEEEATIADLRAQLDAAEEARLTAAQTAGLQQAALHDKLRAAHQALEGFQAAFGSDDARLDLTELDNLRNVANTLGVELATVRRQRNALEASLGTVTATVKGQLAIMRTQADDQAAMLAMLGGRTVTLMKGVREARMLAKASVGVVDSIRADVAAARAHPISHGQGHHHTGQSTVGTVIVEPAPDPAPILPNTDAVGDILASLETMDAVRQGELAQLAAMDGGHWDSGAASLIAGATARWTRLHSGAVGMVEAFERAVGASLGHIELLTSAAGLPTCHIAVQTVGPSVVEVRSPGAVGQLLRRIHQMEHSLRERDVFISNLQRELMERARAG